MPPGSTAWPTNLCLDPSADSEEADPVHGAALSLDDEENGPVQVADQQLQPQEAVERSERRRALERGLATLPDHHRQVLIMRELSGLSYQEICPGPGPGSGDCEIPYRPGSSLPAKNFAGGWELF